MAQPTQRRAVKFALATILYDKATSEGVIQDGDEDGDAEGDAKGDGGHEKIEAAVSERRRAARLDRRRGGLGRWRGGTIMAVVVRRESCSGDYYIYNFQ